MRTWVTTAVVSVLLVVFSSVSVHGVNSCLSGATCVAGRTDVDVSYCGLTDEDIPDVMNCLDIIGRGSITYLGLGNNELSTLPSDLFASMSSLERLEVFDNKLTTVPSNLFADCGSMRILSFGRNSIEWLPVDAFAGLSALWLLFLDSNSLTTLPAGIFEDLGAGVNLLSMHLTGNPGLQCVPIFYTSDDGSYYSSTSAYYADLPVTADLCECTPTSAVTCDAGFSCTAGVEGYTCDVATACEVDSDCDTANGEACCPSQKICEPQADINAGACGDPHMTGFRGQKFDFVGRDGAWYAVVSNLPHIHLNMRVTSPVPSVPEITYITGLSIITTDGTGLDHTIVITVTDPHNMESSCPVGMSSCLADGALHVVVDGEEVMLAPAEVSIAPGVAIAAVNLPGACRSFGFEKYWERKKLERIANPGRSLRLVDGLQDMSEWIMSDPTATNVGECAEYLDGAAAVGDAGLFTHQSEHASFQIVTPSATIRLSHGRLHQLPMRDPTDKFDLPDHLTWQMNLAIDHDDMSLDAAGILGETLVLTRDDNGAPIMQGMDSIRGKQEDYRVNGPLAVMFSQGKVHE